MDGKKILALLIIGIAMWTGCATPVTPERKLAKKLDNTAGEIVKVREYKKDGNTRAILSPADERQLRITF